MLKVTTEGSQCYSHFTDGNVRLWEDKCVKFIQLVRGRVGFAPDLWNSQLVHFPLPLHHYPGFKIQGTINKQMRKK